MTSTTGGATGENLVRFVRYASERTDVALTTRDAAIREAHGAGASVLELTSPSGIAHEVVEGIVHRGAS